MNEMNLFDWTDLQLKCGNLQLPITDSKKNSFKIAVRGTFFSQHTEDPIEDPIKRHHSAVMFQEF